MLAPHVVESTFGGQGYCSELLQNQLDSGGDDGTRTRGLMRDRHVTTIAGVDSKGPRLAADGRFYPLFSLVCGPDVARKRAA